MPQVKPISKVRKAAGYFAYRSRQICNIARAFNVSESTIRNWRKLPEWNETLDAISYEGNRSFEIQSTRDISRENAKIFKAVHAAYLKFIRAGEKRCRIPRQVEAETGVARRKVAYWAKRYTW